MKLIIYSQHSCFKFNNVLLKNLHSSQILEELFLFLYVTVIPVEFALLAYCTCENRAETKAAFMLFRFINNR